jgi:putative transcriptional regulator
LEAAECALTEAGFVVSEPCHSRPSCFDFVARKSDFTIFIKAQSDIGTWSVNDSRELKTISNSFSAASLIIGEQARQRPLQDDTVYTRHDILAVTLRTLEGVLLHNALPLIQASPGGYYVEIDGEALKRRRQELGLSAGDVAEMVRTSRRTIYGYERGMAKASVAAAYNIIWALGVPVAKPVNILEKSRRQHKSCVITTAKRVLARSRILSRIFGRYVDYHVTAVTRAPFDFVISVPEQGTRIIGGIANRKEVELNRRIDEILSVGKVVQARSILITEGQRPEKDILCIRSEDVVRGKSPADLVLGVK